MKKREVDFFRFETVNIPVSGTYTIDRKTGEIIDKQLEYAVLPVKAVTDVLFRRFGFFGPREIDLPEGSYFVVGVQEREADGRLGPHKMLKRRFEHESLAYEYMRTLIAYAEALGTHEQYSIYLIRPGFEDFPEDIFVEYVRNLRRADK